MNEPMTKTFHGVAESVAKLLGEWDIVTSDAECIGVVLAACIQNAAIIAICKDKLGDMTTTEEVDAVIHDHATPISSDFYAAVRDMIRDVQEANA